MGPSRSPARTHHLTGAHQSSPLRGLFDPQRGPTAFQGPFLSPWGLFVSLFADTPPNPDPEPEQFRKKASSRATWIGSNQLPGWATPPIQKQNSVARTGNPLEHLGAVVPLVAWIGYLTALLVSDDPPPSFCVILWGASTTKTPV